MTEDGNVTGGDDRWNRMWEIFHAALERESGDRDAFVAESCADDRSLREEVERLLRTHQKPPGILDTGPAGPGTLTFGQGSSLVGQRIGPYHLREVVGEGGMGVVYSAEQTSPVRRRVALKLVRAGHDSREVLARFESEMQALAVMDHPRIAKVHDAGIADDGRPYFVMEYVPGIPITEYCDLRGLGLRDRLEIFAQACEAIDHAHGKGIIHRDIKPSNLLVAAVDGKPSLKVIDFGVAKATNQKLTERTLFTRQGVLVGTPGYMSPEQAGTTALEVDRRTDIYALGVVLYELLAGAQPFDPSTLRNLALAEMLRIIREEDPPPPWARVTSLGAKADEVAKRRHLDVHSLVRRLRGELEWITMRALEKDAARRYASAADFAADVRRHLANEPVSAGPKSVAYRAGKFLRRHKVAAAVTGAFALMLVAFGWMLNTRSERLAFERAMLAPVEGGVVVRELWSEADIMGTPSPDGRYLSFTDWSTGDLALHDFRTGEDRRLTGKNSWSTPEFAEYSVMSPDGRAVAYAWFTSGDYELRVYSLDDASVRILVGSPGLPWVRPVGWSPDGSRVLAWLTRGDVASDLAFVSVDGSDVRVLLTSPDSELAGTTALSPDGRTVIYSVLQEGDSRNRDIRLRTLDDDRNELIVRHAANDIPMGWSPDGRQIFFASDRGGSWDLWAVRADGRGAQDTPLLVKSGFGGPPGTTWPLGFTDDGAFLYGVNEIRSDVYVTDLDAAGRPVGEARKTSMHFEGTNRYADWSPDGRRLAWISKRGTAFVLVIDEPDDDRHIEVPISSRMIEIRGSGIRWSPDGASVLVLGRASDMESWQGVFSIDTASGEATQIAAAGTSGVLRFPEWSPDGTRVYFLRRENDRSAIVALDLATGREEVVHEATVGAMALSPDGRWIAYTTDSYVPGPPGELPALLVVPATGGDAVRIHESSADRTFDMTSPLVWSPDGEHLLFATTAAPGTRRPEDRMELMRIARGGGEVESTGIVTSRLTHPRFSPDGRRLAFSGGRRRSMVWAVENLPGVR